MNELVKQQKQAPVTLWQRVKRLVPGTGYKMSAAEEAEANAAAALVMVETLAQIQIKTVYGLSAEGVSAMFRSTARSLAQSVYLKMPIAERAAILTMVDAINHVADRIKEQSENEPNNNQE